MDSDEKHRLAKFGEVGLEACAIRLRASRKVTGLQQKEMAAAAHVSKSVLNNAEMGLTYPNREIMQYLYREHRIDFNFMMAGLYAQLPGDVQERLFPALEVASNEWDQKERSGRSRTSQRQAQSQTAT
ncbi:helix-turn-helix domain-containing protein [Paenirhodobacter populi]|nr:helix-turn-helix transcriptional regulator [Sinirhodobacter populi]